MGDYSLQQLLMYFIKIFVEFEVAQYKEMVKRDFNAKYSNLIISKDILGTHQITTLSSNYYAAIKN